MLFAKDVLNSLEPGTGSKIPVGIHAEASVLSVVPGQGYVDFNYVGPDGIKINNKRVWYPDIKTITQKKDENGIPTETMAEAFIRVSKARFAHIVKHVKIFKPEALETFDAPDVETAAKMAAALLTPQVLATKKVNLKVIPDRDNKWTAFGNFPDYIEEHIPGVPPSLAFTKEELKLMDKKNSESESVSKTDSARLYD